MELRGYREVVAGMQAMLLDVLMPAIERVAWDAGRLADHRRTALGDTLAFAAKHSRWHATRLAGIDLDAFDPDDLSGLPVMTKRELMANWDEIVTDPHLNLATARQHLCRPDAAPAFLHDEYHVLTTGGSTGEPGVFCWSRDELLRWVASTARWPLVAGLAPAQRPAFVGARSLRHPSAAVGVLISAIAGREEAVVPLDQPVDYIVGRLNELQPDALFVVSSLLPALVAAAREGILNVHLRQISAGGDQLDRAAAAAATETFGAAVLETYPTTDVGHIASQAPGEDGMYINEDLLVVEAVDAFDRPVEPGTDSHHVLVTSLHQRTLPLIRYRIDDRVRIDPERGRHAAYRKIAAIEGRTDELFEYETTTVHPHVFRAVFARHPEIWDYQVTQTATGAHVELASRGPLDRKAVAVELVEALARAGIADARIDVSVHDELARTEMGKRIRFVPMR